MCIKLVLPYGMPYRASKGINYSVFIGIYGVSPTNRTTRKAVL